MGVKVGGVESTRSPTGAWISGSMDQALRMPSKTALKKIFLVENLPLSVIR